MEAIVVNDHNEPVDAGGLAQLVLDRASSADLSIVTAEYCTGGGVSAVLNNCPRNCRQFGGGYLFNSARALEVMLGVEASAVFADGSQLAIDMAREALRRSRAGIAFAIAAPPNALQHGRVSYAVVDGCQHIWQADFDTDNAFRPDIVARGLAFFAECIEKSDMQHF